MRSVLDASPLGPLGEAASYRAVRVLPAAAPNPSPARLLATSPGGRGVDSLTCEYEGNQHATNRRFAGIRRRAPQHLRLRRDPLDEPQRDGPGLFRGQRD